MLNKLDIEVKYLDSRLLLPEYSLNYATDGSAGIDLRACISEEMELVPGEQSMIGTGIAIHIQNPNYMAAVFPRSGKSTKEGLVLANTVGIIDSSYTGEIKLAVLNRFDAVYVNPKTSAIAPWKPCKIQPMERIAQLVFIPIVLASLKQVTDFTYQTDRGDGGFGHTGK